MMSSIPFVFIEFYLTGFILEWTLWRKSGIPYGCEEL